ncbi:hypothetical protein PILCRDRAFT_508034 [Piloderma croceum F 1598]|uniref:Uncharacterized protein n=1 Tax=Piloderma croceum (strain F 1598) TaxID=765440 RepID=A0A0C3FQ74_PILCF|nr:hypothetical protein PILCRDRAFT_508034 [Piloderma croceum F 1598]
MFFCPWTRQDRHGEIPETVILNIIGTHVNKSFTDTPPVSRHIACYGAPSLSIILEPLEGWSHSSSAGKDSIIWWIHLYTFSILADTTARAMDIYYIVDTCGEACVPLEKHASPP